MVKDKVRGELSGDKIGLIKQDKWHKYMKKNVIVVCVFLMPLLMFFGCFSVGVACALGISDLCCAGIDGGRQSKKYKGDYPELFTIAINSIPGTVGYWWQHLYRRRDRIRWPVIEIIEIDRLGRVMFSYSEGRAREISRNNLIICQKSDDKYVYYYSGYNFISSRSKKFSYERVEELKRKNDWNMNIDLDKCVKVRIVRRKAKGIVDSMTVVEFYRKALGEAAGNDIKFFARDNDGREIYVGRDRFETRYDSRELRRNPDPRPLRDPIYIIMLFQPDGSYDLNTGVIELTDLHNYQDDLRAFKERNNWNMGPSVPKKRRRIFRSSN